MGKLLVGASKVSVTPDASFLPCYTSMGHLMTGIHDPIYVRSIAVSDGEKNLLFICCGVDTSSFADRLKEHIKERGFDPRYTLMTGTSTHSYPVVPKKGHPPVQARDAEKATQYAAFAEEKYIEAVDKAIDSMRPARYGHGVGKCFTNCERCMTLPDGYGIEAPVLGAPVERTMQVIKFVDMGGNPIAQIVNYDIGGAPLFLAKGPDGEGIMLTDELIGMGLSYLDKRVGGDSVSLHISGAAGNTCMAGITVKYDDEGMPVDIDYAPGMLYELVESRAQETALAALDIYSSLECERSEAEIRFADTEMLLPEQERFTGPRGALNAVLAHLHGVFPGVDHVRVRNLVRRNGGVVPLFPGEEYPPKLVVPKPTGGKVEVHASMYMIDDMALFVPAGGYYNGTEICCKEASRVPKFLFCGAKILEPPAGGINPGPVYDDEHAQDLGYQRMHSAVYPGTANGIVKNAMLELFDKLGIPEKHGEVEYYYM